MFVVCLMCSMVAASQDVQDFVSRQLEHYPQSRLLDIYKSCFQDYMGAEHLVNDRQTVKSYLDQELLTASLDEYLLWYYEPCGINGQYVRVSLRAVKENLVSEELLLDAFVRSANAEFRPTVGSWRYRWQKIIDEIDMMQLYLPHYQEDKEFIDGILIEGKYAISHSPDYREAYHPHYRIVEKTIFEREIKPLLVQSSGKPGAHRPRRGK